MLVDYYLIYAGTDINNMTLIASPENNEGILSPMIEKEVNTAGSFSFTMLPTHPYVNSIKRYLTIVDVYLRGAIVFRGRVFDISSDFNNQLQITCEGNLSWLIDNYKPKSDEVLEKTKPFTSEIKNKIAAYNADMESYKHFVMGYTDPINFVGNLIDMETVVEDKKINTQNGKVLEDEDNWVCETGFISYEKEETYYLYVGSYERELGTSNIFYLYGGYDFTNEVTPQMPWIVQVSHITYAGAAFPIFVAPDIIVEPIIVRFDDGTTANLNPGENLFPSKIMHDGINQYTITGNGVVRANMRLANGYWGCIVGSELTEAKVRAAGYNPDLLQTFRVSGPYVQPSEPVHPDLDYPNELYIVSGHWNARSRPSASSRSLGIVSAGETYEYVNNASKSWVEFIYNGQHAYVKNNGSNLEVRSSSSSQQTPSQNVGGYVPENELFWVTSVDYEAEIADGNTWGGGNWGDYMTEWIVNTYHMLIRARVVDGKNVLDILNPKRNAAPVSEMVLSDNLIDFGMKNPDIEAYSYIYPIFEGEAYPIEFPPEIISNAAVSTFGKIYKAIEFGVKPSNDTQRALYRERMTMIKSLYDPTIPQQFTVKGLDKRLVYDEDPFFIIDVGDVVRVKSKFHINGQVNRLCLSLRLDVFNPENSEYTIGQYVDDIENVRIKSLTETFVKEEKEKKKK